MSDIANRLRALAAELDGTERSCEYAGRVLYSIVLISDEESKAMCGMYAQRYYAYGPSGLNKGDHVELLTTIGTWAPAFVASVKPRVSFGTRVSTIRTCVAEDRPLTDNMKLRIATEALEAIRDHGLGRERATLALKEMSRFD